MILENAMNTSGHYHGDPSMILSFPMKNDWRNQVTNEEIFKHFSENDITEAIVISSYEEPMKRLDELRSFIFSARKYFPPGKRPLLIIITKYLIEELEKMSWGGVQYELLHYGHALLKCGRIKTTKKQLLKNPYEVIVFEGIQHE